VQSWDRHLEGWIVDHRVGAIDPVAQALSYAGMLGAVWLGLALVLALSHRRVEVFVWALAAVVLASVTSDAVKAATDRPRPDVDTLVSRPHTSSFPSGHAATGFACATVLGVLLPRWRAPLFALAALIALSRLYVGVHFPLDVVAGAALGVVVGVVVLRARRQLAAARRRSRPERPRG
jgi:undecaprenyl-diphosphatase